MKKIVLAILLVSGSLSVTACGRSDKSTTNVSTSTSGQELTDLKAAHEAGALSDEEYEKKRQEILNKKG